MSEAQEKHSTKSTSLTLRARILQLTEELRQAAENVRHYECDDCWYSCPASGECCNEADGDACNCGADNRKELFLKALNVLADLGGS